MFTRFKMEIPLSKLTNEEKICKTLQKYFSGLRNSQNNKLDLTDNIRFAIKFINDSVARPVPVLESIGIIVIDEKTIAFNFLLMEPCLLVQRGLFKTFLNRNGWKDVDSEKYKQYLIKIVGENKLKYWMIFKPKSNSEVIKYLNENKRIISNEENRKQIINDKIKCNEDDILSYPLVSLEFEREFFNTNMVDFQPLEEMVKNTKSKMEIVKCENYSIRIPK